MTTNMKRLLMGTLLAAGVAGCQLIVDFDRTLIDAGTVDASLDTSKPDTSTPDTSGPQTSVSGPTLVLANDGYSVSILVTTVWARAITSWRRGSIIIWQNEKLLETLWNPPTANTSTFVCHSRNEQKFYVITTKQHSIAAHFKRD